MTIDDTTGRFKSRAAVQGIFMEPPLACHSYCTPLIDLTSQEESCRGLWIPRWTVTEDAGTGLWFASTRVVFWAAAVLLPRLIPTHQSAQLDAAFLHHSTSSV